MEVWWYGGMYDGMEGMEGYGGLWRYGLWVGYIINLSRVILVLVGSDSMRIHLFKKEKKSILKIIMFEFALIIDGSYISSVACLLLLGVL